METEAKKAMMAEAEEGREGKTKKEENDGSKESSRRIEDLKWGKEVVKFEEEVKKLVP